MVRRGERTLQATLRFVFDRRTADRVKRGVISIEDALEELEDRANDSRDAISRLTEGFRLAEIAGQQLSDIGQAILGPLRMGAEAYVMSAGRAEATSRRWLDANYKLEKAQFRIGRVAATAIVPSLEKAADLAEMAADFVADHPGVIEAALKIGVATATLGAVGLAVTRGVRLYADIKLASIATQQLLASRIMDRAADKQLAAATGMKMPGVGAAAAGVGRGLGGVARAAGTVLLSAAAVYMGGEIGQQIADYLGPSLYGAEAWEEYRGDTSGWAKAFKTLRESAASWVGIAGIASAEVREFLGMDTTKFRKDIHGVVAAIGGMDAAAGKAEKSVDKLADAMDSPYIGQAVDMYIDFQREMADMDYQYSRDRQMFLEQAERDKTRTIKEYEFQRARMIRDFARDQLMDLRQFERDQTRAAADFDREQGLDEEEYYRDRLLRAKDFGEEMARFEEDHAREMQRMREDHQESMRDIVADRDAFAAVDEMRRYEKERQRAEDEAKIERTRRNKDFAKEVDQDEEQFRRQKKLRADEFERRLVEDQERFDEQREMSRLQNKRMLDDMREDHERELLLVDEQNRYELRRMQAQFVEEKTRRSTAFADQLRDLDASLLGERGIRNRYYALMTSDLTKWMKATRRSFYPGYPTRPSGGRVRRSRQMGGYVGAGTYELHAGEFVLSRPTAQAMERGAGGRLTQQTVLSGFTRHSLDLNITVSGLEGASKAAMLAAILPVARQAAAGLFSEVMGEMERLRG